MFAAECVLRDSATHTHTHTQTQRSAAQLASTAQDTVAQRDSQTDDSVTADGLSACGTEWRDATMHE